MGDSKRGGEGVEKQVRSHSSLLLNTRIRTEGWSKAGKNPRTIWSKGGSRRNTGTAGTCVKPQMRATDHSSFLAFEEGGEELTDATDVLGKRKSNFK